MQIALIGGTHGNEPVGLEVMKIFQEDKKQYLNSFKTFWGNPEAFKLGKRYVDTDLNRAFGKNGIRKGYELTRAEELESHIKGSFDFSIDLHTTTSNMGETVILNNTHPLSQKAAAYLYKENPKIKIIEEVKLDDECNHLNRLCPAGLTIELGPVANNVISADIVFKMHKIVKNILEFDFEKEIELAPTPYYKMTETVCFPSESGWYLHPDVDRCDFKEICPGQNIFVNILGETKAYEGPRPIFPFFINEAAYLENKSAFLVSERKENLFDKK